MTNTTTIAFNLLFITKGRLTGPGYYAVQLIESFVRLPEFADSDIRLICYIQPGAAHHFSNVVSDYLRPCRDFEGRIGRVVHEQTALPLIVRRDRVDLLFSPAFVSPLWGARHRVVGICDMYYKVIPRSIDQFQRQYWHLMIPLSVQRSDHVITISECSREDIEKYLPRARGRVTVTPLASRISMSDSERVDPIWRNKPYVLMVANLTANKNCEVAVAAICRARERGLDLELVHVGQDNQGRLASAIATYEAEDFVHSMGKVSDNSLRAYYTNSLCVVTPSLYEGFGMPAVEAQAMGAVLVSSDRGALPEAAGSGALFFDPTNVDELASAFARVATDPDLRERLRTDGVRSAARFSWERTARMTFDVFQDVLNA